jgi:hypothetical protein
MNTRTKAIHSESEDVFTDLSKEGEIPWSPPHLHPIGPWVVPFAMGSGYKVRTYESCQKDEATGSGTVVLPVDPSFTISADSAEKVLDWIQTNVVQKTLLSCRVYQVCPMIGSYEPAISVAIGPNGSFFRVSLDPARGAYGQLRRVRDVQALSAIVDESPTAHAA